MVHIRQSRHDLRDAKLVESLNSKADYLFIVHECVNKTRNWISYSLYMLERVELGDQAIYYFQSMFPLFLH